MECFQAISVDKDCRAVVVSGAGKMFTSGIYKYTEHSGTVVRPSITHFKYCVVFLSSANSFSVNLMSDLLNGFAREYR